LGVLREEVAEPGMNGQNRKDIRPGQRVEIVLKKDQRTGNRTVGIVKDVLTSAAYHSHGIKVRLDDGRIGRVQEILPDQH
jgi:uncharacterized repeat protein (TIGR03833 family)